MNNSIIVLIGTLLIVIVFAGVRYSVSTYRADQNRQRWTVVCDGKGRFSYVNGYGTLSNLDFYSREEATKWMVEEQSRPPTDMQAYHAEQLKREKAFRTCP